MSKLKASITVFTAIVLIVVMATGFIGMDLACAFNSKSIVSSVADMAIDSALANYDKTLAENYGLYGVETDNIGSSFENTLNSNLQSTNDSADLFRFDNINADINGAYSLAETTVLESQMTNLVNECNLNNYKTKKEIDLFDNLRNKKADNVKDYLDEFLVDSVADICKYLQKAEDAIEILNGTDEYKEAKALKDYLVEVENRILENPTADIYELNSTLYEIYDFCRDVEIAFNKYCIYFSLDDMGYETNISYIFGGFLCCNKIAFQKANALLIEYKTIVENQIDEVGKYYRVYSENPSSENAKNTLLNCFKNLNDNFEKYAESVECFFYDDPSMIEKKGDFSSTYPKDAIKPFCTIASNIPNLISKRLDADVTDEIQNSRNPIDSDIANSKVDVPDYQGASFINYDMKAELMFNKFVDDDDWWENRNYFPVENMPGCYITYPTTWSRICESIQYFPLEVEECESSSAVDKYIMNMFSSYTDEQNALNLLNREIPNGSMNNCQVEYIITGKSDSNSAVNTVANRIFAMRFFTNYCAIYKALSPNGYINYANWCTDVKMGCVSDYLCNSLFARWMACESYYETALLLNGETVLQNKSVDDMHFNCDLTVNNESYDCNSNSSVNYADYLYSLLAVTNRQDKMERVAKVIEVGMYDLTGNYNPLCDYYGYLRADVNVDSKYLFLSKVSFTGFESQSERGAAGIKIKRIRGY